MSSTAEIPQQWMWAALQASERAVQDAHRSLTAAAARFAAGVGVWQLVQYGADLLQRELRSQADVAEQLQVADWQKLAALRLEMFLAQWEGIERAHEQQRLHPAEIAFEDLPRAEDVAAVAEDVGGSASERLVPLR